MPKETSDIDAAYGIGNLAFYRMCAEYPKHVDVNHVSDKLVFISRVYSVSRGLGGQWDELARAIVARHKIIDSLLNVCRQKPFMENLPRVIETHLMLDQLTCDTLKSAGISATGRASFASKYLHFHAPDAFPILDSFSSKGLRSFTPKFRTTLHNPTPYSRFCERLAHYIATHGKSATSLRRLDTELVEAGRG